MGVNAQLLLKLATDSTWRTEANYIMNCDFPENSQIQQKTSCRAKDKMKLTKCTECVSVRTLARGRVTLIGLQGPMWSIQRRM